MKYLVAITFTLSVNILIGQNLKVQTVVGTGTPGYVNGAITSAQINTPQSIDFDYIGNIYFCDNGNYVVRKIDTAGVISTVAGTGNSGHINGPNLNAEFGSLLGLCVLPNNDIYVTEYNHRIRRISGGMVSDYAGSGSSGASNGIGTTATFNVPSEISKGVNNNLFVLDRFNHKIRSINLTNDVTTDYAGSGSKGLLDGTSNTAKFDRPYDFCVDSVGNIFVADRDNNVIRKVDILGNVTTIAGNGLAALVDANGTAASFNNPAGIAIDKLGNIYIGDRDNHVIRKIDPYYNVTTFAGNGSVGYVDSTLLQSSFNLPTKIAIDTSTSILYISDVGNHAIRKIELNVKDYCDTLIIL